MWRSEGLIMFAIQNIWKMCLERKERKNKIKTSERRWMSGRQKDSKKKYDTNRVRNEGV
jgi:hypothetical protein